jgi:hypothetical protein
MCSCDDHDPARDDFSDYADHDLFEPTPHFAVTMLCVPPDHARTYTPDELRAFWTRFVTDWPEAAAVLRDDAPAATEAPAWELATAFDVRDDAHITVASVWATRRKFAAAGWQTRLVSDVDSDTLQVQVRPRPGCARPTFGEVTR